MAPFSPRSSSSAAQAAFARGDFAAVRRLSPKFVAAGGGGPQTPRPLFAPQGLVLGISAGTAVLLTAAWIYALLQR